MCAEKYLVRENICTCAQKSCNPPNIYYLCPKHLYECTNILICAEILSLPAEIYSLCTETYLLRAEIYMLRGNTFKSPQFFFVYVRKLLCPMHGFWASYHFGNAVEPQLDK